jgi:hypothetical protein
MKYIITAVFATLTFALSLVLIKIGILVVTDGLTWILVGVGVLFPTIVSALITVQAFLAAKQY